MVSTRARKRTFEESAAASASASIPPRPSERSKRSKAAALERAQTEKKITIKLTVKSKELKVFHTPTVAAGATVKTISTKATSNSTTSEKTTISKKIAASNKTTTSSKTITFKKTKTSKTTASRRITTSEKTAIAKPAAAKAAPKKVATKNIAVKKKAAPVPPPSQVSDGDNIIPVDSLEEPTIALPPPPKPKSSAFLTEMPVFKSRFADAIPQTNTPAMTPGMNVWDHNTNAFYNEKPWIPKAYRK
ncbi:hypothetical protein BDZ45DRAFT_695964 [Acephala macrosclerotiorum]|nr:hypothetical protein BDZ45DRAFT_695964 [Acephala macrosclerotiorum]